MSTRRVTAMVYEGSEWVTGQLCELTRALIVQAQYQGLGIKRVKVIAEPSRRPVPGVPYVWQFTADVTVRALGGTWG
ncbi:MAG: hypothetical protein ACLP9Y_18570 [Mycobacterium sp.]